MTLPVSLSKVVDAISKADDGYCPYINRRTGEIAGGDLGLLVECDYDDLDEDLQRVADLLREITSSQDWLLLPQMYTREALTIMGQFVEERCDDRSRLAMLPIIRDGEPLDCDKFLISAGLYRAWHQFWREKIPELAAAWLADKGIAFCR